MDEFPSKIQKLDDLALICQKLRKQNKIIVLCHGCFDFLHFGHLRYFKAAKQMGHILIVTVTPDEYINKGPGRPVYPQEFRSEFVAALEMVDFVAFNKWPSAVETIYLLRPHIYVKGSDYLTFQDQTDSNIFYEIKAIRELGGQMVYTKEETFSSTQLLHRFASSFTHNSDTPKTDG